MDIHLYFYHLYYFYLSVHLKISQVVFDLQLLIQQLFEIMVVLNEGTHDQFPKITAAAAPHPAVVWTKFGHLAAYLYL